MKLNNSIAWKVALVASAIQLLLALVHIWYEEFRAGNTFFWPPVAQHGWHLLILAGLTFATLYVLLNSTVAKPIHELYLKLYMITRGDRRPIEIRSYYSEIQEIVDGINHLLKNPGRSSLSRLPSNERRSDEPELEKNEQDESSI